MSLSDYKKEEIGNAVLYCGDSAALLRAGYFKNIGAIVSDPPNGIGYQHGGGASGGLFEGGSKTDTIIGDDAPFQPQAWIDAAPDVPGGKAILLWGADHFRARLPEYGSMLAWDKHLGRGPDDSFTDCEWAWCGRKSRREVFRWLWKGLLSNKSVWDVATVATRVHVSQKPVELMRWCIDKVRPLPDLPVLDPYMGSGSTGVACATLGLPFIGVEIDPAHFDMACLRIENAQRQGQLPL